MSSSQTMTAPAVGHRPPDPGPDMSLCDYPGAQPQNDIASPRNDSAMRAEQSQMDGSQNEPPAVSGMIRTRAVLENPTDGLATGDSQKQSELDKQWAASSLLAQLLGNQPPAPPAQEPEPKQEPHEDPPADNNVAQPHQSPSEPEKSTPAELTATQDGTSLGSETHGLPEINKDQEVPEGHPVGQEDASSKLPNLDAGDLHRLVSKSQAQTESFPYLDPTAPPKNALEALQQNEILTASYLASQNLDMSGLSDIPGYSQGQPCPDAASSIAGSEPRIQAFAKLEFDDGHFYVNTYSFILGRDVRAARAALQREMQAKQAMGRGSRTRSSSGGHRSHTPHRVKREGSAIMGSVVSDRGGIMGFDPDVPPHLPPQLSRKSSNSSYSGPPLHANPAHLQTNNTDYNALAMQSLYEGNGDAKPVDTLALLPSPDACPTIPIHPPASADGSAAAHRGISRKHVKIAYNFDKNLFEMEVIGRNGAFIGADWLAPGQIRPLHSGDYIQIGGVRIRFLLPDVPIGETGADRVDDSYMEEDENAAAGTAAAGEDGKANGDADGVENGGTQGQDDKERPKVTKIVLKTKEQPDPEKPRPSIEAPPETPQQPVKRRGPGRPPKDGIMSKRERAEIAREQKLAAKREANGGVTPPPSSRSKVGRPRKDEAGENGAAKPEKRKYTKRKKPDGTSADVPIPSVEGGEAAGTAQQPAEECPKPPPPKKRKPSRSPSPNYPPESAYTPEDLAKPPYNYAVLIFDALTEAGTPLTLKQIYRALKLKYPYFRFKCETEGWTSSVRHNLNGNSHLFMHAERDGKGWSWQLRPGASVEKEKKRRPSPPPPSQPPPAPANNTQQHYMPPPAHTYANQPGVRAHMRNQQQFQFPSVPQNPYSAPTATPQHSSPYPPAQNQFSIPTPIRNNLPPAFVPAATPATYTSPYASDPPPQLQQLQRQAQQTQQPGAVPPQQHQSPYAPQNPSPLSNVNPAPQPQPPPQAPQMQQAPNPNPNPAESNQAPVQDDEMSFTERANKAVDDFEAALIEDYEDKDYIREVLKSARARVLGDAKESSFPGGEPKDEAVIMDALRNLIGSLKEQ